MNITKKRTPVLGFAGYSGSGKTTLLEQLIPRLKQQQIKIGLIKHSHHDIELDAPTKDSYRLRQAGTDQLLLATAKRHFLFFEYHDTPEREPSLEQCLVQLDHTALDLILVEGFRDAELTKIEIHRPEHNKPFLFEIDKNIIALAINQTAPQAIPSSMAQLNLDDPNAIVEFILHWLQHGSDAQKFLAYASSSLSNPA